jgi:hypothetical protein
MVYCRGNGIYKTSIADDLLAPERAYLTIIVEGGHFDMTEILLGNLVSHVQIIEKYLDQKTGGEWREWAEEN